MHAEKSSRPDTKSLIRQAARRLFARHGYEGVSMRDIALAVGVRQSAIYNHFASKQALLVDLMLGHMEDVLARLAEAVPATGDARNDLAAFTRFHLGYHIDHNEDVFLAYMEVRSLEGEGRRRIVALRDAYEARLRAILERGLTEGRFSIGDPAVHARAVLAMLTGVTTWYRDGGRLDRARVIDTYGRAVLQGAGAGS